MSSRSSGADLGVATLHCWPAIRSAATASGRARWRPAFTRRGQRVTRRTSRHRSSTRWRAVAGRGGDLGEGTLTPLPLSLASPRPCRGLGLDRRTSPLLGRTQPRRHSPAWGSLRRELQASKPRGLLGRLADERLGVRRPISGKGQRYAMPRDCSRPGGINRLPIVEHRLDFSSASPQHPEGRIAVVGSLGFRRGENDEPIGGDPRSRLPFLARLRRTTGVPSALGGTDKLARAWRLRGN